MQVVEEIAYRIEAHKVVKDWIEAKKIVKELKAKGFDVRAKEVVYELS